MPCGTVPQKRTKKTKPTEMDREWGGASEGGCGTLREGASLEEGGGPERKALPEGQNGHACLAPLRARL